jgi:four helix bundle protein
MARIERFEEITAWQKARQLTRTIYLATRNGKFARDFPLRDQIRRAAVSVMANIAEGFERDGDREFVQFLSTAKGSCGEVRSHLYVAEDEGYFSPDACASAMELATDVSRLLSGFIRYLQESDLKGRKFSGTPND